MPAALARIQDPILSIPQLPPSPTVISTAPAKESRGLSCPIWLSLEGEASVRRWMIQEWLLVDPIRFDTDIPLSPAHPFLGFFRNGRLDPLNPAAGFLHFRWNDSC